MKAVVVGGGIGGLAAAIAITRQGWRAARIGTLAQLQSPVPVALRNAVLRATPSSSLVRSLAPVLTWTP